MEELTCNVRVALRVAWSFADWMSNLFFIIRIDEISDGEYTGRVIRDVELLTILYTLIFALKSVFYLASWYKVIHKNNNLSIKVRIIQLWLLQIVLAIFSLIICSPAAICANPFFFLIILMHIATITKQCFILGSFPYNVILQYMLSLIFACDFTLIFLQNFRVSNEGLTIFDYRDESIPFKYYAYFIILLINFLFLILIAIRPVSILCEGKYPKFVMPRYRDYYDSEDGGWRNNQQERVEETAISTYKNQLLHIPAGDFDRHHNDTTDDDEDEDDDSGGVIGHSLINMITADVILPTQEPSQFDKFYYWSVSLLFLVLIHIPILVIFFANRFEFIEQFYLPIHYNKYSSSSEMWSQSEIQLGILINLILIIPTIFLFTFLILLFIFRMSSISSCLCIKSSMLFWCLFNKQHFDMIAIHRGMDKNKEEYYSSLWSFKKRRKKSSGSLIPMNTDDDTGSISIAPKSPPQMRHKIASLKDTLIDSDDMDDLDPDDRLFMDTSYKKYKKHKKHKKKDKKKLNKKHKRSKKRIPSINSDESQELAQYRVPVTNASADEFKIKNKKKDKKQRKNRSKSRSKEKKRKNKSQKQLQDKPKDQSPSKDNDALGLATDSLNYESITAMNIRQSSNADASIDKSIEPNIHE